MGWALGLLAVAVAVRCSRTPEPTLQRGLLESLLDQLDDAELEPAPSGRVDSGAAWVDGQERPAILFQAPGRARFHGVHVSPAARLSFGVGISEEHSCVRAASVTFRVSVGEPSQPAGVAWSASVGDTHWHDVQVDLARWAGRDVDLTLEAEFAGGRDACRPAWSRPRITSSGETVRRTLVPVRPLVLLRDLLGAATPPIDLGSFVGYGRLLQAPADGVARPRPAARADGPTHLSFDVPSGAVLELSGELLGDSSKLGPAAPPVHFVATLDGSPVLERLVRADAAPMTFSRAIPLERWAGRKVSLDLAVTGGGPAAISWWTSARVLRRDDVPRQTAPEGRNVLLVVVDTLRADQLGLYGSKRPTSPNLDRLGQEGLVFDQALSACSWTQPAVATLLTGRSPLEHGMTGGIALGPGIETIAESFQRQGLTTFGLSSNPIIGRREGFARGFETFVQIPWARAESVDVAFEDWLQGHRDTRWFAYLHYIDPHDGYDAPAPFGGTFSSGLAPLGDDKPMELLHKANFGEAELALTHENVEYLRAAYDGEILYWDSALGRLLDMLRSRGLLDNTVVVVTADHGEEFREHGKLFHGFHLYDETIRVPLVVRAPGLVPPGRQTHIFATQNLKALAIGLAAGVPPAADAFARAEPVFSHTAMALGRKGFTSLASVRTQDWKYILRLEDDTAELYDLRQDPGETARREKSEPAVASRYDAWLRRWLASGGPVQPAWRDPGLMERLRAAGYIQ
jgi:arylsulfatase A-like enzyme